MAARNSTTETTSSSTTVHGDLEAADSGEEARQDGREKTKAEPTSERDTEERDEDGVRIENRVPVVRLTGPEDPFSPLNMSFRKKWIIVLVISSAAFCITCCSSMIALSYEGMEREFDVSREVATLGLTMFILGLGFFPLLVGPLSEFFGRRPVYSISFFFFLTFNFQVAFANSITTFLIGRFLTGAAGASFLSVAGGSVSDIFAPNQVSAPMGVYTAAPFLGPIGGPLLSGFINQNLDWRWTWYVLIIWSAAEYAAILLVPETFTPALLVKKAKFLRSAKGGGREDVRAPLELDERSIPRVIAVSCLRPFQILATEPMALALCTWTALLLGILYMSFSAWGIVYGDYGFNTQQIGLSFCGLGLGVLLGACSHPFWQRAYARVERETGRRPPPEEHLRKGLYAVVLAPLSLFWFAFTTYMSVPWWVSQLATIPFGVAAILSFQAVFVYLVDYLRPVAASAMAANSAMRSVFGGAFPLFTGAMFNKLGTQWALALCAFLLVAIIPFPFLFFFYGSRLRRASKFAQTE